MISEFLKPVEHQRRVVVHVQPGKCRVETILNFLFVTENGTKINVFSSFFLFLLNIIMFQIKGIYFLRQAGHTAFF